MPHILIIIIVLIKLTRKSSWSAYSHLYKYECHVFMYGMLTFRDSTNLINLNNRYEISPVLIKGVIQEIKPNSNLLLDIILFLDLFFLAKHHEVLAQVFKIRLATYRLICIMTKTLIFNRLLTKFIQTFTNCLFKYICHIHSKTNVAYKQTFK